VLAQPATKLLLGGHRAIRINQRTGIAGLQCRIAPAHLGQRLPDTAQAVGIGLDAKRVDPLTQRPVLDFGKLLLGQRLFPAQIRQEIREPGVVIHRLHGPRQKHENAMVAWRLLPQPTQRGQGLLPLFGLHLQLGLEQPHGDPRPGIGGIRRCQQVIPPLPLTPSLRGDGRQQMMHERLDGRPAGSLQMALGLGIPALGQFDQPVHQLALRLVRAPTRPAHADSPRCQQQAPRQPKEQGDHHPGGDECNDRHEQARLHRDLADAEHQETALVGKPQCRGNACEQQDDQQ